MLLPRFIKKLLAVFRGSVAPPLIFMSVLLGFWTGLMPGWSGLHTTLAVVVLILNVHIGLFLLTLGIGKALSLAAAPVLYHVGVWVHAHLGWLPAGLSSVLSTTGARTASNSRRNVTRSSPRCLGAYGSRYPWTLAWSFRAPRTLPFPK